MTVEAQRLVENGQMITLADGGYREWQPHRALADHVVCLWVDPARPRDSVVLPDGCIDVVWDGRQLQVAGPDTRAVSVGEDSRFVGVRFRPGAAPGFLGAPASALVDQRVDLFELWGHAALELADRLQAAPSATAELLEHALLVRLADADTPDALVRQAVAQLGLRLTTREGDSEIEIESESDSAIAALATHLGTSERTLRRRCTEALGYGPKTLERILRFRRALRLLRNQVPPVDAAHLAGYVDQSHLTNECRRLADTTPAALAAHRQTALSANGCD